MSPAWTRRSQTVAVPGPPVATAPTVTADAEAMLRRLEVTITRRLDGLLQGQYLGLVPGPGSEAGESREYRAGDDVRRMDWPVTARTTVPYVRQTVADRELETWLLLDLSASLDFGTALCEKRDLAIFTAAAVTHLTVRGGNRVGAVVANGERVQRLPARSGRTAARALLRQVVRTPRAEPGQSMSRAEPGQSMSRAEAVQSMSRAEPGQSMSRAEPGATDLAAAIELLHRPPRRRGLVVVISDFLAAPGWERPLRALASRHDVLAVEVVDPRELELPDVGLLSVVDPETGDLLEVQTSRRALREQYAAAAAEQRAAIATGLRHAGAAHLRLRTDRDPLTDIVRFVVGRRRGQSVGAVR